MNSADRPRSPGRASLAGMVAWLVPLLLALAGCAHDSPGPVSPSAPTLVGNVHISFRVYDSVLGEIASAATTVTFPSNATDTGASVAISLSRFPLNGVDPLRAAVYEPHAGGRLGRFVTATTDGVVRLPRSDASYDVFLMSTASGADYRSIDARRDTNPVATKRYATMRMARAGEDLLGQPAQDQSDESFRFMAGAFTAALNPFGLEYGGIDFVGAEPTADIVGGWVTPGTCGAVGAAPGAFWLNTDSVRCPGLPTYVPNFYGGSLVAYGLARTYLGGTSSVYPCTFLACPQQMGFYFADPKPPLTPAGADAVRYMALVNGALR